MAHFGFQNNTSNTLKMDASLTAGSVPGWQRKALESSNSSINSSLNMSVNKSLSKTPSRTGRKTAGQSKSKSARRNKVQSTPGDRFIPNRSRMNFELAHYMLTQRASNNAECQSPSKFEYRKALKENLNMPTDLNSSKIMAYQGNYYQAPESGNNVTVMYNQGKTPGSIREPMRNIPQAADRVLDAPDIVDDYYLNLLDWSCNNMMAVALSGQVYLWNAATAEINMLLELEQTDQYVSSLSWIKEGNTLAVGTSTNEIQLWDVNNAKRLRVMRGHSTRVGSLSWNSYILSSGARDGNIYHHDVRLAQHHIGSYVGHTQEICGLKWSYDGRYLASGGNDNCLNIWSNDVGQRTGERSSAICTFTQHQAAVKAVAWCPWQPSVLASGGGTSDRNIKLWNCNSRTCLGTVDTHSQVSAILWSQEHKELISGHGFANNQLIIWKYPTMDKVTELTGHQSRILHMAMSPDGTTVVSAAADETLRLWKCFTVNPKKKKSMYKSSSSNDYISLAFKMIIR